MATTTTTRTYYDTRPITIGRACMIAAAVVAFLFAFGVLKDRDHLSWAWIVAGLVISSWAIG